MQQPVVRDYDYYVRKIHERFKIEEMCFPHGLKVLETDLEPCSFMDPQRDGETDEEFSIRQALWTALVTMCRHLYRTDSHMTQPDTKPPTPPPPPLLAFAFQNA
jgi:hypothetical protein